MISFRHASLLLLAFGALSCSDTYDGILTSASAVPDATGPDGGALGTRQIAPNVYEVPGGVDFRIDNRGANDYLFTWRDESGTFEQVVDPTLVLRAGQTYRFVRTSAAHPFQITDASLPITGTDGSIQRATTDPSVLDAAGLQPADAFIADPAPSGDAIVWTPGVNEAGELYYTCTVLSHTGMTGRIRVQNWRRSVRSRRRDARGVEKRRSPLDERLHRRRLHVSVAGELVQLLLDTFSREWVLRVTQR